MCLKTPKAPVVEPVAPVAPLQPPQPMALAEGAVARRETGVSQLRIRGRTVPIGTGGAARAGLTLQDRKQSLDEAIAASGG